VKSGTSTSTARSARRSVVDLELSSRMQVHRLESAAVKNRRLGVGSKFQVAEEDSTDDEAHEDEREVGTAEWRLQQERRRSRYRTTTSTSLYDVETIRREREAKEAAALEQANLEKQRRLEKEKAWAEASQRVEEEANSGGGVLNKRMRRFTEEIERGWTKDYAGKSTGLTAKQWDAV
jgi:hypothetical protein